RSPCPGSAAAAVRRERAAGTDVNDSRSLILASDIFVPEIGTRGDEVGHQLDASRVLYHLDPHPSRAQQILFAHERAVLTDDDVRDAVEKNRARTHCARR